MLVLMQVESRLNWQAVSIEVNRTINNTFFAFIQPHSTRIYNGMPLTANSFVLLTDDRLVLTSVDDM